MNTKRCTNLDVKKLFEEYSIKEILEKQKEIQLESDRKKIELRTLVGERYRDLIQAADTIREMKLTAEGVALKMITLESEFQQLHKNYLIGFKIETPVDVHKKNVNGVPNSVIIQLKILSDIPEHIWTAIANKDLLFATQLFIVAQHINYSLIFEVGSKELAEKYPIASKQWDILNQFKHIIKDKCHSALQSLNVSVEHVANCLASLLLLNGTPFTDLLQKLIITRNNVIERIMKNEENQSVKNKIKMCIETLVETMNLIHSCFKNHGENSQGLVINYLEKIKDVDANVIISRLDVDQNLVDKFLPSITINHKPFSQDIQKDSSPDFLENSIENWLQSVREFCSSQIVKQLELINSVKGLHKIRKEATEVEIPPNWNEIWEDLSMKKLNFWTEFLQPLVTRRAKSIINGKWQEAVNNLKSDLIESLTKLAHDKSELSENDLRWYVWKDSPSDIPQKLSKNGGIDNKRSLLMKAKAYSTNVVKLCDNFDASLHSLLMDLDEYLFESERRTKKSIQDDILSSNMLINYQLSSDRTEVQEHLQATSTTSLEIIIEFIKTQCNIEKSQYGTRDTSSIFIARFLSALTCLCPNLNRCFTLSKLSESTATNIKWQSLCDNLKEQSISLWTIWADTYKNNIIEHRNQLMTNDQFDELKMHLVVSELERVVIEEEADEGKKLESEILVPYQPSMPLLKFLTSVNKDLNKIIPHTLPKKILHNIIEKIATEIFDYYLNILKNTNFKQKQAFQILFDLKYCTLLMVPKELKYLNEKSTEACDKVLSNIDPFDFDTFHPFIEINVKKSIQRSLLIFGNLIPHLEQLHSILGARNDNNTSDKSNPPAILALCTGAPWFPPLTVTAPTRNVPLVTNMVPDKVQRKKTASKEHTRSDSASATIKSGAAAFFGAMGTDWFGTN